MVAATMPLSTSPRLSAAFASTIRDYIDRTLMALEDALERHDESLANGLAAAIVGFDRLPRVRLARASVELAKAWVDINKRWRRARFLCAFPTERAIAAAMAEQQPPRFLDEE